MTTDEMYTRLAVLAVETYGQQGTFEYEPMTLEDLEPLAEAFCALGCAVTPGARGLTVTLLDERLVREPVTYEVGIGSYGMLL